MKRLFSKGTCRIALLAAGVLIASTGPAGGQSTDAVLSGTVTDPSGAVVPGAAVTAESIRTAVLTKTTANLAGVFVFPALQPGVYRVTAEQPGFKRLVYDNVELELSARVKLNLPLQLGSVQESIEVQATSEMLLGATTSSVGVTVRGRRLEDAPAAGRGIIGRALAFAPATPLLAASIMGGQRRSAMNMTLDGINVQDNYNRPSPFAVVFPTIDQIEEVRLITSPADAEFGRGSGQFQMVSRSGSNEFHGSLFELHRNTALNANTWFNNQRGRDPQTGEVISPRDVQINNTFGGRLGGPVIKNRTFFHALVELGRARGRFPFTATAYTEPARRGIFRFFPGVQNRNANALAPTVDLLGNPVRPPQAAGPLQEVSLFGRDPVRLAPDHTGAMQRIVNLMPLPNDFRFGDGLNTAGYTWSRGEVNPFNKFNAKLDHLFSDRHRLSYSHTFEYGGANTYAPPPFPQSPGGDGASRTQLGSLTLTSTLGPRRLNEFRAAVVRPTFRAYAPWERSPEGLLRAGSEPYQLMLGLATNPLNPSESGRTVLPLYQASNHWNWLVGRHSFKAGGEVRFVSANDLNSDSVIPRVSLGTGGVPLRNLSSIAGIGPNLGFAEGLLNELSGSVGSIQQFFNSPGGANPQFLPGEHYQRSWRQREFSLFFKDDFKLSPSLTLNLGLRYEWYGVPFEANGKSAAVVGGEAGLFGLSGASLADLYQPGHLAGSLTRLQLVGPRSPNSGLKHYDNDNNNFAPALGLSWSLPPFWKLFGNNNTVLRLGYGMGYERQALELYAMLSQPQLGLRGGRNFTSASHIDLASLQLPLQPLGRPLETVPLTDRTQTVRAYERRLRTPYIQNWNVSLRRALPGNLSLDVRYVGAKGTRLMRQFDINERNIFENGILEAFRITQAGGASPLFNDIFRGLNIPGLGVVDGVRITGSDAARFNSTTQGSFANHGVASLADYLYSTNQFTGERGGLLRRAGLPENWVVANPQFRGAMLVGNPDNSTYHSLQVEVLRRLAAGWTFQGHYTWSRAIGGSEGDDPGLVANFRDLRNWQLDKRLMSFHRTHLFRGHGLWELPFGPGKTLGRSRRGPVARIIEGWQVGLGITMVTGAPIDLVSNTRSWNFTGVSTPLALAPFPKGAGEVQRTGQGVIYFAGLAQVPDPSIASLTTLNNIRARSNLRAIADSTGQVLLVNPTPGVIGNLGRRFLEGPGRYQINANLIKRLRISERKEFELRADAESLTNHPQFGQPIADINSPNFGRITFASGNRVMAVSARLNF